MLRARLRREKGDCDESKRCSGTLRRKSCLVHDSMSVKVECRRKIIDDQAEVTAIDKYFDPNVIFSASRLPAYLNDQNRWENVVNELNELCIYKRERYCKYENQRVTTYTLPVVGRVLVKAAKMQQSVNWFMYNGVMYDPGFIYDFTESGKKLKQICPLITPLPKFENGDIKEFRYSAYQADKKKNCCVVINHKRVHTTSGCKGWTQTKENRYLEIDLSTEQSITHIGIAGRYPNFKDYFVELLGDAFKAETEELLPQSVQRIEKRFRHQYSDLKIVDKTEFIPSYVTSFRLYYRRGNNSNWVRLSDLFSGCNDSTSEALIDLRDNFDSKNGLIARYIRIEPIDYVNRPSVRLSIYGINAMGSSKVDDGEKGLATVAYTVSKNQQSLWKHETKSYNCRWWYSDTSSVRRMHLRNEFAQKTYDNFQGEDILVFHDHLNTLDKSAYSERCCFKEILDASSKSILDINSFVSYDKNSRVKLKRKKWRRQRSGYELDAHEIAELENDDLAEAAVQSLELHLIEEFELRDLAIATLLSLEDANFTCSNQIDMSSHSDGSESGEYSFVDNVSELCDWELL